MELMVTRSRNGKTEYLTDQDKWSPDPKEGKSMAEDIAQATARGLTMSSIGNKPDSDGRFTYGTV